jgi:hypothetical protein
MTLRVRIFSKEKTLPFVWIGIFYFFDVSVIKNIHDMIEYIIVIKIKVPTNIYLITGSKKANVILRIIKKETTITIYQIVNTANGTGILLGSFSSTFAKNPIF